MPSLVPNSTQVPNIIFDNLLSQLDEFPLKVLLVIIRKTIGWEADEITGMRKMQDWIAYSQFQKYTGGQSQAISRALKILEDQGLIEIRDSKGNILYRDNRLGKKLFYRLKTSMLNKEVTKNAATPNLFVKQSLSNIVTKETNTKPHKNESGYVQKQPCPIIRIFPGKYPRGHIECTEYILSLEEDRKRKFINRPKQYVFLHKILGAGFDFPVIDKTLRQADKRYGANNWDLATIAAFLEKGSANA